jgi:hypothetical protein
LWGTDFRICIQFFQLFFVEIIQVARHVTQKNPSRSAKGFFVLRRF